MIGLTKSVAADFIKKGDPRQRDLPGHGTVAVARRAHRDAREEHRTNGGQGPPGLHRSPADGPPRHAGGDRAACGLSRFRRIEIHHRRDPPDRRRFRDLTKRRGSMHILVIGAAGMIGRKLVGALAARAEARRQGDLEALAARRRAAAGAARKAVRDRDAHGRSFGAGRSGGARRRQPRRDLSPRGDRLGRGGDRLRKGLSHQSRRHALSVRRDPRAQLLAAGRVHELGRGLRRAVRRRDHATTFT